MAGKLSSAFLILCCIRACASVHSCSRLKKRLFSETYRSLRCSNVTSEEELGQAIEVNMDFSPEEFELTNSELRFISHDAFRGTTLRRIGIYNTSMMSLTDTNRAFQSLEDSLQEFVAERCSFVGHWNWDHLSDLKKINMIKVSFSDVEYVQKFPNFSPSEHKLISLRRCGITDLAENAFSDVRKLEKLWMEGNNIVHIERSMFPKPAESLYDLDLRSNKIRTLPDDMFTDMPFLSLVYLTGNQIHTVSEKVFGRLLQRVTIIIMEDNGLICDCRVKWIVNDSARSKLFQADCKYPPHLKGKPLMFLKNNDLWC